MKFLRAIFGRNAEEVEKPAAFAEPGPDPVMAALAELEVKRLRQALAAASQQRPAEPDSDSEFHGARPNRVVKTKMSLPDGVKAPSVNIWDLDDADVMPVRSVAPVSAPAMSNVRPARSKTRVLGFDAQPTSVVPLFDDTEAPVADTAARQGYVMFPAGWLVVKSGPGVGTAFALSQGVSQIGRGLDQTVALDFGDMAISRQQHAAIAYDPQSHQFHVGHGGKSNLVRLNGKPLLSTEALEDGDEIQIGETTLLLKVLCTSVFNWSQSEAGGDGHDMAIA
ncbi:Forkhead-associated (FHA) domain [Paracoccaceae bacterium]